MVDAYYPASLQEALKICNEQVVTPYAGGTDLMVKSNHKTPFLFLSGVKELTEITQNGEFLSIGAACIFSDLLKEHIPNVLKEAISGIAAPAIRNMGTIGGNICNASPAGDTLPILYAMDARLILESMEEKVEIPINEFIVGPKKTICKPSQLLTKIKIPIKDYSYSYQKIGARKAQAISKLSFVGLHTIRDTILTDIRIAFGAVGATIVRDRKIEECLIGKSTKELDCESVIREYEKMINPIDDQRSSASYRKSVCMNLLREYLNELNTD